MLDGPSKKREPGIRSQFGFNIKSPIIGGLGRGYRRPPHAIMHENEKRFSVASFPADHEAEERDSQTL